MHEGQCLCGAVRFTVQGALPQPDLCHCSRCRRWSGHAFASADVQRDALAIEGEEHLRWFSSSDKVRRGFCGTCGSSLFFDPLDRAKHSWIGVAMGAFSTPTHTTLKMHIFVGDQGDYYAIADGLPQNRA